MFNLWIIIIYFILCGNTSKGIVIKIERAKVIHNDDEFVELNIDAFMFNRTVRAMNFTWIIKKDWPRQMKVHVKAYEFLNNEYRPFAIDVDKNFCDYLTKEYNLIFYEEYNNGYSNPIPPKCPLKKGLYTVYNYAPSAKNIPINLPFTKAMLEYTIHLNKRIINHYQVYFLIDRDIDFRQDYT